MQYLRSNNYAEALTDDLVRSLHLIGFVVCKDQKPPFRLSVVHHNHTMGDFFHEGNCTIEYHSAFNQYRIIFVVDGSRSVVTFLDKTNLLNFLLFGEAFEIAYADVQHLEIERRLQTVNPELYIQNF